MERTVPENRKREAAIHAPTRHRLLYADSRVIDRPGWWQIITPSAPYINEVVLSEVDADRAEDVIEEVIATYRALGVPTKWCVGPWTKPDDFGERLERRGFRSWGVRGMACDTSLAATWSPGDVDVREVDQEREKDDYLSVTQRGWSIPLAESDAQRVLITHALAREPRVLHAFVAYVDGTCIGSAALNVLDDHAYLTGAQVLESARGRGAYRALVFERLAFLRKRGIDLAVTQAREATSAPILERLGFETVFVSRCYQLDP